MPAPLLKIFWSHRLSFIITMCSTFLVLALIVLKFPTRATVRSAIEIGTVAAGDKQEAFESPENIARRIPSVYAPAALLAMAKKDISPSVLGALTIPTVDSIGRTVVIVSTVDPDFEQVAREFQETTADLIIKDLEPRARALRESIATRIALANAASDDLEQQIKHDASEIEHIGVLIKDLRGEIEKNRASLAPLYQRTGTALQSSESTTIEAHIRELQDQISSQMNVIGNLILERSDLTRDLTVARHLREAQVQAIADAQFEKNSFDETHISLPPSLTPETRDATRRVGLLFVAFTVSLLSAFGLVVLSHNMSTRSIGTSGLWLC
jgi:uncharacterized coiled-coil protein SlyX